MTYITINSGGLRGADILFDKGLELADSTHSLRKLLYFQLNGDCRPVRLFTPHEFS